MRCSSTHLQYSTVTYRSYNAALFMRAEYKKLNPLQLVPALEIGGTVLADSIAILFVNLPFPSRRPRRNFFLERYVMPWHYSDLKQWSVVWMWGIIHGISYGILSVPQNTFMDLKNGMCEIQINFFSKSLVVSNVEVVLYYGNKILIFAV